MWLWEMVLLRWCGKTSFPGSNPRERGLGLLICKPRLCPACLPSTPWLQCMPSQRSRGQNSTSRGSSHGERNQRLWGHEHVEETGSGDGFGRVQGSAWKGEELQLRVQQRVHGQQATNTAGQPLCTSQPSSSQYCHRSLIQGCLQALFGIKSPTCHME